MDTTESSKPTPEKLFCRIRKKWVSALPEEIVRQQIIKKMVEELGYPIGGIGLEQNLSRMTHLRSDTKLPNRRIDIAFFHRSDATGLLSPLLLIECKAVPLSEKVVRQALGYNFFLHATFTAITNGTDTKLIWIDPVSKKQKIHDHLLPYKQLLVCLTS